MTDLGDLHHFLGISVTRSSDDLFLSRRQYAVDLLQRAGMAECHSTSTPVDTRAKLSATDGAPVADATQYRSLAGALQYLTLTRPDLAYAVQQVCLFMHDPREPYLALLKRILRYVKGTLSTGLHIGAGPVSSLTAYSMQTGQAVQTLGDLLRATVSSSATTWCLGPPNDKLLSLVRVRRPSIVLWRTLWLRPAGFGSFFRSFMRLYLRRRLSTVIMSVLYT